MSAERPKTRRQRIHKPLSLQRPARAHLRMIDGTTMSMLHCSITFRLISRQKVTVCPAWEIPSPPL